MTSNRTHDGSVPSTAEGLTGFLLGQLVALGAISQGLQLVGGTVLALMSLLAGWLLYLERESLTGGLLGALPIAGPVGWLLKGT